MDDCRLLHSVRHPMLLVLLLVLLPLSLASDDEKCGTNEQFYDCGACDSSCDKEEICVKVCRKPGSCGCIVGYRRDKEHGCVPMEECQKKAKEGEKCGENEEMFPLGACDGTCSHPHLACVLRKKPKPECGCKKGYVRDDSKKCIKLEDCK
ncbi:hypothetical protein QR680_006333 [Steinernema hermaphroditum]|uniref:TIL domain-containing protein n=1 Tax=Steinernema hermaphroditum TaxID=289476 RepID=A0AA39HWA9_9BILA|nr:hypothetical protein QR680_006333 [Steinernema hermaphroditum]